MTGSSWWKGSRGEWYVVAQFAVFILMALGPRRWPGLPEWSPPYDRIGYCAGGSFILLGGLLMVAGFFSLGTNLTILPRPRVKGALVESGTYRIVRHPIYSGIFFAALGWGMWERSWLLVGYALLLFMVLDVKARREENWLTERFPEYEVYKKRVKRLIPYIY